MLTAGGPVDRLTGHIKPQVPGVAPQVVTQKQGAREMQICFSMMLVFLTERKKSAGMPYTASSVLFFYEYC